MFDGILWALENIAMSFYNLGYAITHPGSWLAWLGGWANAEGERALEIKQSLARFIYYGGSVEFFFVVFTTFLVLTAIGIWKRSFMWGLVRGLEGLANGVGRFFAWAGLIMVLQQIIIVFLQRIFRVAEISFGPGGLSFTHDLSWFSEELKLYNAMIVALCVTYTFVQGGHVRVDLVYAAVSHRTKRMIDMFGSIFFMMPVVTLTWMYAWFFLWRHLVTPNPNAGAALDRLMMQARALRWNVETIGFSPNGFNAYFVFKIMIIGYCALVFLQAMAFFWRSFLEWAEGEESIGRYQDKDTLGEGEEAYEGAH
ncbi:TRAP transporter small permease subunit [Nioella nitratireducens]|uniref:TRAP transporter small permease subunit n=1 Tax=Nioella nitratireducens TaxID=1287720 RepID=UPI0008FD40EE|nr:C4-dicarboxylate ABC transporter permease [Nioella nitratireducens]